MVGLLLGLGVALWWARPHETMQTLSDTPVTNMPATPTRGTTDNKATPAASKNQQTQGQPAAAQRSTVPTPVREYMQKRMGDPQYDWKQPINFYGKVVDDRNQSVADADVHFAWNDLSENGTSSADAKSDDNGLFSLENRIGKRLYVDISKAGYYTSHRERIAFEYANPADGLFTPDSNHPVVFQLRKKGIGAELITSQYGMAPDFPIHVSRDGTPVKIDLLQRKIGDSGQMQISEIKPPYETWKQATSWSFRMEIPDGGFVEENDEFPFEAPEAGYQPVVEFKFQKGDTNWTEGINKSYYIQFGNPPRYGYFSVKTVISMGGAILSYGINSDGARNLEPK